MAVTNQVLRLSALMAMRMVVCARLRVFRSQGRKVAPQIVLQHGHRVRMAADAGTGLGGSARLPAHDKHRPHPLFHLADALRHCRWRDVQHPRGAVEAAFAHHSGDSGKKCRFQHDQAL